MKKSRIRRLISKRLSTWAGGRGHLTVGPLTVYGRNAMHGAVNIRARNGFFCFRIGHGDWPWYLYVSPDATPQRATVARGPGLLTI